LRNGDPDATAAAALAKVIGEREQQEPFPPVLEAQLADVYYQLGRVLAAEKAPEPHQQGIAWLRRAVAAEPAHKEQHFWPGRPPCWGFPHEESVAAARALLQRLEHP